MCPVNLWGDLPVLDNVRTPLLILKEQAAQLGEMTSKILEAEISKPEKVVKRSCDTILDFVDQFNELTQPATTNDAFMIDFDIVVPTMNFYRITIIQMKYFLSNMYPVILFNALEQSPQPVKANNEKEFTNALESILTSEEVKKVLRTLLVYAKAS